MDKIIIWGAGGQAIVLEELLMSYDLKIEAFFENNHNVVSPVRDIPIYYEELGFHQWLSTVEKKAEYKFLVAIGGNNGNARAGIGNFIKSAGVEPYTAIHKKAFVAGNAVIGEGSQVLANSAICAKAIIGDYCIINTAASVDHECVIGNNVHIGPGARLAGCIQVGDNTFVGTNATILPRVIIGQNAVIGAGAVVTKNVADNVVIVGNPGIQLKTNYKTI